MLMPTALTGMEELQLLQFGHKRISVFFFVLFFLKLITPQILLSAYLREDMGIINPMDSAWHVTVTWCTRI